MTLTLEVWDGSNWIDKTSSCVSLRRHIRSNGLEELDGELVKDVVAVGQEIRLKEDGSIVFEGIVYEVDREHRGRDVERCGFKTYDKLILWDRHVVYRAYPTGTKAGEIIRDLASLEDIPINLSGVEDGDSLLSPWEIQNEKALDVMKSVARGTNYWLRMKPCLSYLSFDGENDYVEVAHSSSLNITDAITIEAFVKVNSFVNDYPVIVGKNNAYVSRFDALDTATGRMMASFYIDGTWVHIYGNTEIDAGKWIHHVVTFKSDVGTKLYLNTNLDKEDSTTGTIGTTTNPVLIGNYEGLVRYLDGLIAYVRIYNRALSASEIRHNYLNPMNPVTDGLVLWLNFHNIQDNVVPDLSGNDNDGTIYGASQGYEVYPKYVNSFLMEFKPKVIA